MKEIIDDREYKKIILDILINFHTFCEKNDLKYFLFGGTLIGAIRHKGFIPWDDDIDVCMLRDDYERFISLYKSEHFRLLSLETDKQYAYSFAKLIDDRTILVEKGSNTKPIGAYIDIFPLDNCLGDSFQKACKHLDEMNFLCSMKFFKQTKLRRKRGFFKNLVVALVKVALVFISLRRIALMISKKAKKYMRKESRYVGEVMNNVYGYGEIFEKSLFEERDKVLFEEFEFYVPKHFNEVLTSMYGDYMKMPPLEKRVAHHDFQCWYK